MDKPDKPFVHLGCELVSYEVDGKDCTERFRPHFDECVKAKKPMTMHIYMPDSCNSYEVAISDKERIDVRDYLFRYQDGRLAEPPADIIRVYINGTETYTDELFDNVLKKYGMKRK